MDRPRISFIGRGIVNVVLAAVGLVALWQYFGYGVVGALYVVLVVLVIGIAFNTIYAGPSSAAGIPSATPTVAAAPSPSPRAAPTESVVAAPERKRIDAEERQMEQPKAPRGSRIEQLPSVTLKIQAGVQSEVRFILESGDRISGTATEEYGEKFDWYLFDDAGYAKFYDTDWPIPLKMGKGKKAASLDAVVPHSGAWHLVIDNKKRKTTSLRVEVNLTRTPKAVVDAEEAEQRRKIAFRRP